MDAVNARRRPPCPVTRRRERRCYALTPAKSSSQGNAHDIRVDTGDVLASVATPRVRASITG